MTDFGDAIANKMADSWTRQPVPFEPSEELEEAGRRLDVLRENNPTEYEATGLGRIKQRVALYRARKADHEKETSR